MTGKNIRKDSLLSKSINDTITESIKESNESAIVVGASLSGLMTGIALSRAGMRVTILERTRAKPRSGAVLQVDSGEIDRIKTAKFMRKLASGGIRSAEAWSSIQLRLRTEAETDSKITLHYDTRVQTLNQNEDSAWIVTDKGETFR